MMSLPTLLERFNLNVSRVRSMLRPLVLLVMLAPTSVRAQLQKATVYAEGTVTEYLPGGCGKIDPGSSTAYCYNGSDLAIVRESRGLMGASLLGSFPSADPGREVYLTRNGVSMRLPDGTWDNIPNEVSGQNPSQTKNDGVYRSGLVNSAGQLLLGTTPDRGIQIMDLSDHGVIRAPTGQFAQLNYFAYDSIGRRSFVLTAGGRVVELFVHEDGGSTLTSAGRIPIMDLYGPEPMSTSLVYREGFLYAGDQTGLYVIDVRDLDGVTAKRYNDLSTPALPDYHVHDLGLGPGGELFLASRNPLRQGSDVIVHFDTASGVIDTFGRTGDFFNGAQAYRSIAVSQSGVVSVVGDTRYAVGFLDPRSSTPSGSGSFAILSPERLNELGVPIAGRFDAVDYRQGRFVYTVSGAGLDRRASAEVAILEGERWTVRDDDAPGNLSSRFGEADDEVLADGRGGTWWVSYGSPLIVHLDSLGRSRPEYSIRPGRSGAVDGGGKLIVPVPELNQFYHVDAPAPRRLKSGPFPSTGHAAPFGDAVWTHHPRSATAEKYIDGASVSTSSLGSTIPDLASDMVVSATEELYFYERTESTIRLYRYDTREGFTRVYDFSNDFGQAVQLVAAPGGGVWVVGRKGIGYFSGLVFDRYDAKYDPALGDTYGATIDREGSLYLLSSFGSGIVKVTIGSDGKAIVDRLASLSSTLPTVRFEGSTTLTLDDEGALWLNADGGFAKLQFRGTAPLYRPGGKRSQLTGLVYVDLNDNKAYDEGEGAAGVVVSLNANGRRFLNLPTDDDGRYTYFLEGSAESLKVSLAQLPRFTESDGRRLEFVAPAGSPGIDGIDFRLTPVDYSSLLLQSPNRTGAWGFDNRSGFRNAFMGAVTNLSLASKTYRDLEVGFMYVNGGKKAPRLPKVTGVLAYRLKSTEVEFLYDKLIVDPVSHRWRLPNYRAGRDFTIDTLKLEPAIAEGDDTVRVTLTLPAVAPRETYIFEILTETFAPEAAGTPIYYGYYKVGSVDISGGPNDDGVILSQNGFLVYEDAGGGGEFTLPPGIGLPLVDLNSPFIDPGDPPQEGTFIDPSEAYVDPSNAILVFSSYDPNDKNVDGGLAFCGNATGSGALEECVNVTAPSQRDFVYTVRFENTGNFPAKDIYILDTLDQAISPASIRILESSFPVTLDVFAEAGDTTVLRFSFENIYLPFEDSLNDGWVRFAVRLADEPSVGQVVTNTASIYFDQNPPIITNTVRNVFERVSGLGRAPLAEVKLEAYPNPTTGDITLVAEELILNLEVLDVRGAVVLSPKPEATISLRGLAAGVYLVRATTTKGVGVLRVVLR